MEIEGVCDEMDMSSIAVLASQMPFVAKVGRLWGARGR